MSCVTAGRIRPRDAPVPSTSGSVSTEERVGDLAGDEPRMEDRSAFGIDGCRRHPGRSPVSEHDRVPVGFVDEMVVRTAGQSEVVDLGSALLGPGHDVVGVAPAGGVSHPGKVHPWSLAARIVSWFRLAYRFSVWTLTVRPFSLMRWKNTAPLSPSRTAAEIGKLSAAPVVACPHPVATSSALAVTTRANGAPAPTRPISMRPMIVENLS